MARFLINTSLALETLTKALGSRGIAMEHLAPVRELPTHCLMDVNLTSVPPMTSAALLKSVTVIEGVHQALPVPDAEPG